MFEKLAKIPTDKVLWSIEVNIWKRDFYEAFFKTDSVSFRKSDFSSLAEAMEWILKLYEENKNGTSN